MNRYGWYRIAELYNGGWGWLNYAMNVTFLVNRYINGSGIPTETMKFILVAANGKWDIFFHECYGGTGSLGAVRCLGSSDNTRRFVDIFYNNDDGLEGSYSNMQIIMNNGGTPVSYPNMVLNKQEMFLETALPGEALLAQAFRPILQHTALYLLGGHRITSNVDLNEMKQLGMYYCDANTIVVTLKNCPTDEAFRMTVDFAAGVHYRRQILVSFSRFNVFVRIAGSATDIWGEWVKKL